LEVHRKPVPTKGCPPEWPNVCKWVVFSDLHVSPKTLDVCLEVLREVRDAARLRGAGVLFLGMSLAIKYLELTRKDAGMIRPAVYVAVWHSGDFWHVKGPLAVRPLNAVIAELQTWTQPTVMLVGNHDQVLLSGLDHALPPLAAACRSMIMIDQPCIFMDALWLPYRRDVVELQAALQQAGSVTAVFAHADVVGSRHQPPCLLLYLFRCTMLICKYLCLCSCWAGMRVHSPADTIDVLHVTWTRWLCTFQVFGLQDEVNTGWCTVEPAQPGTGGFATCCFSCWHSHLHRTLSYSTSGSQDQHSLCWLSLSR